MNITLYTKKYGYQTALFDDEDMPILTQYSLTLYSTVRHKGIYVNGYKKGDSSIHVRIHRIIMNAKPGEIVDHINRNPLDNRKVNLRITTSAVNNQNAGKRKDGVTSQYKGVSRYMATNRWKAQIQINKKKISLGIFDTEDSAALAYNRALDAHNIEGPRNQIAKNLAELK